MLIANLLKFLLSVNVEVDFNVVSFIYFFHLFPLTTEIYLMKIIAMSNVSDFAAYIFF